MYIKSVKVRDVVFGEKFLFCIPLSERTKEDLVSSGKKIKELNPDVIEWRADAMECYPDSAEILQVANELRIAVGNIPIIFTTRHHEEGGFKKINAEEKMQLIKNIYPTGCIDLIDIEVRYADKEKELIQKIQEAGLKTIISYHNLQKVLPNEEIVKMLKKQQETNGDIVKAIFHMDTFHQLVLLSKAVDDAKKEFLTKPVILGGDGNMGMITRLAAESIGSAMTYVAGGTASSHPSQMDIRDLKIIREKMNLN